MHRTYFRRYFISCLCKENIVSLNTSGWSVQDSKKKWRNGFVIAIIIKYCYSIDFENQDELFVNLQRANRLHEINYEALDVWTSPAIELFMQSSDIYVWSQQTVSRTYISLHTTRIPPTTNKGGIHVSVLLWTGMVSEDIN